MEFCKFFYSLFIRLSWFHGLGHRFNRLARVDLYCFFLCFFKINFMLHHLIDWKLGFLVFFIYFSRGYSDFMTRVIVFLFFPSTLGCVRTGLHNLFWFAFYRIITVQWLGSKIWQINRNRSNMLLSQYLKTNVIQYIVILIFKKKYRSICIIFWVHDHFF
jgi:hypothetical protein